MGDAFDNCDPVGGSNPVGGSDPVGDSDPFQQYYDDLKNAQQARVVQPQPTGPLPKAQPIPTSQLPQSNSSVTQTSQDSQGTKDAIQSGTAPLKSKLEASNNADHSTTTTKTSHDQAHSEQAFTPIPREEGPEPERRGIRKLLSCFCL